MKHEKLFILERDRNRREGNGNKWNKVSIHRDKEEEMNKNITVGETYLIA